jgi:hypothetical protein
MQKLKKFSIKMENVKGGYKLNRNFLRISDVPPEKEEKVNKVYCLRMQM